MKKYLAIAATIVLVGCTTFYSSIVTVTDIRKSVINEFGVLYRAGQISPETDGKIQKADDAFKVAAYSLEQTLVLYKAGLSTNDPALKLQEVKAPVQELLNILAPYVIKAVSNKHQQDLNKATQL